MPRDKPVRVPIDEIRRTLEDLDGRRTGNGAGGRPGPPYSIVSNSSAYQSTHRLRQESARVPLDEIRTTLEDLDRRHAERCTLRRHESQKTEAKARKEPVRVPLDKIRQKLDDLDRQHADTLARGRRESSRSTTARQLASQTPTQPQKEAIRVRPGEVARAWDDIQRQRAEERGHQAQVVARRDTVMVPDDELRRTMAAITQRHAEERRRERTARLRPQHETGQFDRRRAEEVRCRQLPTTPERTTSSPRIPVPQAIPQTPQTPPPRKRLQEPQPEGLLTPPPTGPDRPRKRTRPSRETALLQRESPDTILRYHESRFRDKERESEARSWCEEVPLTLQVETAQSFYQAFTDERTLPISHCNFCYRKQPLSELTKIRWRRHLTPSLLQATAALQECRDCFSADDDAEAMVCHECYAPL